MRAPAAFDSIVLAAVVRDLRPCVGSRVRRVAQGPGAETAFELGGRETRTLLISIDARWARLHLAGAVTRGELSPFGQLLRARLAGARLLGVEQPPFERVVTLRWETEGAPCALVAELMGRHSNLILVQDGVVAGAAKVITRAQSSVREVVPGRAFVPPPRDRPPPDEVDAGRLQALLAATDAPLAQALTAGVLGISPVMARELAVRADLDPERAASAQAAGAPALHEALADLVAVVRGEAFAPLVYLADGLPAGFAPFPLRHVHALPSAPAATMSAAVALVMNRVSTLGVLAEQRGALEAVIRTALRRAERAIADLERALGEAEGGDTLRAQGELLLAYASQIPPGSTEAVVPGYDGVPVTVRLDPALTPIENARKLFDQYAKARDARPAVESRLRAVGDNRRYLASALAMAATASDAADLAAVRQELIDEGYLRQRRAPRAGAAPPRTFALPGGAQIIAGRSNHDNERVTFKVAGPDDLWFHARGVPGAHVVLRTKGRAPSDAEIAAAASAAAYFSSARDAGSAAVDYTQRRYVRKPRGSRPGIVTYERERTVQAVPRIPGGQQPASQRDHRRSARR